MKAELEFKSRAFKAFCVYLVKTDTCFDQIPPIHQITKSLVFFNFILDT